MDLLVQCVRSCFGRKNAPILLPAHLKFSGCETIRIIQQRQQSDFFASPSLDKEISATMRCILTLLAAAIKSSQNQDEGFEP